MLPLFIIPLHNVVPSVFHIFLGEGQNLFSRIFKIVEHSTKNSILQQLEKNGIFSKVWYQQFSGKILTFLNKNSFYFKLIIVASNQMHEYCLQ